MIEFWLCAGLLCLVALGFLLIPLLRGAEESSAVDRTAENVSLYRERLHEVERLQRTGGLSDEQLQVARNEAARMLLADTEPVAIGQSAAGKPSGRLRRAVPFLLVALVPLCALALYRHWGALDALVQARQLASIARTPEAMTARLEQAVRSNPQLAQGWYFLGRSYMAEERPSEAANAFEQAVGLTGRQPELLGQWAQALYFAGDRKWNQQLQDLTDEALKADPQEVTSLGLLGIAAYESQRYTQAIDYWQRLLLLLPAGEPSHQAIEEGLALARRALEADGAAKLPVTSKVHLQVRVELSAAVRDKVQPGDTVFVFARAVSGTPMPLAVKRLRVADLPAQISLTDSDAMLEQLKLSAFGQVQLQARVSRAGDASKGEWVGQGPPLASTTREQQRLIIDRAEGSPP
jgi:cytochrome c-type biogenesis protein CcmH